jgi:hypothetical protein
MKIDFYLDSFTFDEILISMISFYEVRMTTTTKGITSSTTVDYCARFDNYYCGFISSFLFSYSTIYTYGNPFDCL